MFLKLLRFGVRKGWSAIPLLLLGLIFLMIYFHLPWSVRLPIHRAAPQVNRVLMKSGYFILQNWDEAALVGRDVQVQVDGYKRADRVFGGYPSQGMKVLGRVKQLESKAFTVGYSESRKNPLWVAYRVFDVDELNSGKRPSGFKTDSRTRSKVSHKDYTHSGYDRGHMAPNYAIATRYGKAAQRETFFMSNIIPQNPRVNRGIWKDLEMRVAKKYGRYFGEVWVITGPVFQEPIEKLKSGVPIPSHYYKIIVDEKGDDLRVLAFLIEKDCPPYTRIRKKLVSIDQIETLTGLDFFPEFDKITQENLEAEPATRLWPWIRPALRYHFK